jgi:predicted lactoylglutathione lyase
MDFLNKVLRFYSDGFKNLPKWGKQVWLIILIKLFIMFVVLKIFFFPNFLKTNFSNDTERSNHVLENLTNNNQ